MKIDEALELSDEWIKGVTLYEGAQGWRVACNVLATEVRRLTAENAALRERITAADAEAVPVEALRKIAHCQLNIGSPPLLSEVEMRKVASEALAEWEAKR